MIRLLLHFCRYNGHHERSKKNKSMLSLVGDNMLDPNIAAEEGQVYIYAYNLAMLIV